MKNFWFLLGLGFISTHELDAVIQHEWRLLYVLRSLPEALAANIFVALHVPLFAALVWLTHHPQPRWHESSRLVLMGFLIVHVGLHLRLSGHALYTFHSPLSKALIFGGGVCGALYLLALLRERRSRA
ncbi:MAG: DUF6713 family protein [Pseudomonadota bacterium]